MMVVTRKQAEKPEDLRAALWALSADTWRPVFCGAGPTVAHEQSRPRSGGAWAARASIRHRHDDV